MLDATKKRSLEALRKKDLAVAVAHLRNAEAKVLELEARLEDVAEELERVDEGMRGPRTGTLTALRLEMACRFETQEWERRAALVERTKRLCLELETEQNGLREARVKVELAHRRLKALA